MIIFYKINIFFGLLLISNCLVAQITITTPASSPTIPIIKVNTPKDKLAFYYFEQKEFEKANSFFEDLYNENQQLWYPYYFKSLLGAKEFNKAEKITKKEIKQNKTNCALYVNLGKVYKLQNELKKESESYNKEIKELVPIPPNIQNLANTFIEEKLFEFAIETYNKARELNPEYPYFYERADIYKKMNNLPAMINEYLDALEFRESEIQTVQSNLQNSLGYDDEVGGIKNPILKQEIQKRIQKNPDKIVLTEFLIQILMQQKEFDAAFVHCKSLDKRLKEEGFRINELAKVCISNKRWETAKRCYDYLIEKGTSNPFYNLITLDILNLEYIILTEQTQPKISDFIFLEQKLTKSYESNKTTNFNSQILKNLVELKAYYLNKSNEAIVLLEDYISTAGITNAVKSEYKILLGDIYLMKGEIWEASLLYSQVEKSFKYETIGQEAKFKNAKLSFYAGDFSWAKTQADVLKGATTKLIANDALDLSLIINDAIGVDTNDVPLKLFASAELLSIQNKFKEAIARMDSINLMFSTNTLGDDIYFKKAQIYFKLGKYVDVENMYKNILEYYPTELYGDDAQFKLAQLYDYQLLDKEKAKQAYQDVLTKFPGSVFNVEARFRYRELRGDTLSN